MAGVLIRDLGYRRRRDESKPPNESDPLNSGGSNQLEFQEAPSLSLALPFPFYISGFTGSAGLPYLKLLLRSPPPAPSF